MDYPDDPIDKAAYIETTKRILDRLRQALQQNEASLRVARQEYLSLCDQIEKGEAVIAVLEGRKPVTAKKTAFDKNLNQLRGDALRNEVVEILEDSFPNAMHYREILNIILSKGYTIGGKTPALNLAAHLTKEKRIQRTDKRGIYILKEKSQESTDI